MTVGAYARVCSTFTWGGKSRVSPRSTTRSPPWSTDPVRRPGGGDLGGGTSTLHTVARMTRMTGKNQNDQSDGGSSVSAAYEAA